MKKCLDMNVHIDKNQKNKPIKNPPPNTWSYDSSCKFQQIVQCL